MPQHYNKNINTNPLDCPLGCCDVLFDSREQMMSFLLEWAATALSELGIPLCRMIADLKGLQENGILDPCIVCAAQKSSAGEPEQSVDDKTESTLQAEEQDVRSATPSSPVDMEDDPFPLPMLPYAEETIEMLSSSLEKLYGRFSLDDDDLDDDSLYDDN